MFSIHAPRRLSLQEFPRIIQRTLLLLISLSILTFTLAAQDKNEVTPLEPGKPIERELAGDAAHSYSIKLAANQFLHVVVEQKGIDVVVILTSHDGVKVAEIDSPNGAHGPEEVYLLADASDAYQLDVRSLDKNATAGRYKVSIIELRVATAEDGIRMKALRLFGEAEEAQSIRTKTGLFQALEKVQAALPLFQKLADVGMEARVLNKIGYFYYLMAEYQKSLEAFQLAVQRARAAKDRMEEADILSNTASVYHTIGNLKDAIDTYLQVIPVYRVLSDRAGEANALNSLGSVYDSMGERQPALDQFTEALALRRASGDKSGQASTLNNIGSVYIALGDWKQATDCLNQALTIWESLGDTRSQAIALHNLCRTYEDQGEMARALDYCNRSLPLRRDSGDQRGEAASMGTLARIHQSIGELQVALDHYQTTLAIRHRIGDRYGEAVALSNLGTLYKELGETQKALDFYNKALPLRRQVNDRQGEASTLTNIGTIHSTNNEPDKGLEFFNQALPLWRAVKDSVGESKALGNIGIVYLNKGDYKKALEYLVQSLDISRALGDRKSQASSLAFLADVYVATGDGKKALEHYNQALAMSREIGSPSSEVSILHGLAILLAKQGQIVEARTNIESALRIVESQRLKLVSQSLRTSYTATAQNHYQVYIDLLMQLHKQRPKKGFNGQALQASERGRARSLLETLGEANADIRQGVDPRTLERERELQQKLNARAQQQSRILGGRHTKEQAEALAREVEALTMELQQTETRIRQTSPRYANLTQPLPLSLTEIQTEVLDKDTLLLEYSLGEERSYLWAVTPTSITSYELPRRAEIETAARRVYDLLKARNQRVKGESTEQREARIAQADSEVPSASLALSQMVLAPVASQLGKKRLAIVADGMLQYIPFAALPIPSVNGDSTAPQPLLVDHEIVNLPSASTLAVLRREVAGRKPAPKTVVAIADPVFVKNDVRVKGGSDKTNGKAKEAIAQVGGETIREFQLIEAAEDTGISNEGLNVPRLPGSRKEAEEIVAMVPASERKLALDFDANRATATSVDLSQYRYVHFSTHGFLNSVHPELSGIVFSLVNEKGEPQDGFLRAHEVFNLRLPAELVVLSACQTGIGKEVKGEGLVSLTRGFMYAGAPRVVVSLWSVSENGTAELMVRFYREMLKNGKRPAEALRAAQISLMKEKKWSSPFYWAAFTLQGEWK